MIFQRVQCAGQGRPSRSGMDAAGFSLIEMIVVMAIVGVLAGLLVPALARARESARTTTCMNNLRRIGEAMTALQTDGSGIMPDAYYAMTGADGSYDIALKSAGDTDQDTFFQLGSVEMFACPNDDVPVKVPSLNAAGRITGIPLSYAYNVALPLLFQNVSRVSDPADIVAFYDGDAHTVVGPWDNAVGWADNTIRYRHAGGANFLFVDGHVETRMLGDVPTIQSGVQWVASARNIPAPAGGSPDSEPDDFFPSGVIVGGECVELGQAVEVDGPLFSNTEIRVTSNSKVHDLYSAGKVYVGIGVQVTGDILCNGEVDLVSHSTISGNVSSRDDVMVGMSVDVVGDILCAGACDVKDNSSVVGSSITCGGNVMVNGSVGGTIKSGGDAWLKLGAAIQGDLNYTGALTKNDSAVVSGSINQVASVEANPAICKSVTIPNGTTFSAGGTDRTSAKYDEVTLAPGTYGAVTLGARNKVYLTSGKYYLSSLAIGDYGEIYLDCSGGNIEIYVDGNVAMGFTQTATVTGGSAANVYLESTGDILFKQKNRWHGTAFAPNGDVTVKAYSTYNGYICARDKAFLGAQTIMSYVAPAKRN
jgi:prepilin-type processing-associated H-X9-DG protein/prepilin-type N-terminal cleavage/methylation domain-containing protein